MNKFLNCILIVILNFVFMISLLTRGYHSIKVKRINASNNSLENEINFSDNYLLKSLINNENNSSKKAFTGGMDVDGQVLYICRVRANNEIIPGKYSPQQNKCAVTHQKKELKYKRYQLLVESNSGQYKWINVRRPVKHLPPNIVLGGISPTGQFYYICQCRLQSQRIRRISEQIGKVHFDQPMDQWIATVPFSGQEIQCFDYSVLIMV